MNYELGTSCKLAPAGELEALREEKDKSEWTKEDILSIRDKLTKEFNIDKYNPKNKKDCTE